MNKSIVALMILVALALFWLERGEIESHDKSTSGDGEALAEQQASDPVVSQKGESGSGHARISCEDAPTEAITNSNLPEELNADVSVECWRYGHVIGAAKATVWNFGTEKYGDIYVPTAFNLKAFVPSEDEIDEAADFEINHSAYFTRVEKRQLSGDEVAHVLSEIKRSYSSMPESEDPSVIEILAVNNTGITQRVFIARIDKKTTVGYGCTPVCNPEKIFSLIEWKTYHDVYGSVK